MWRALGDGCTQALLLTVGKKSKTRPTRHGSTASGVKRSRNQRTEIKRYRSFESPSRQHQPNCLSLAAMDNISSELAELPRSLAEPYEEMAEDFAQLKD